VKNWFQSFAFTFNLCRCNLAPEIVCAEPSGRAADIWALVGRCKLKYVDPQLESDWFQTLTLEYQSRFQNVPFTFNSRHYTLGVILYELLTLRRPFEGDNLGQLAVGPLHSLPGDARLVTWTRLVPAVINSIERCFDCKITWW
jgi:serine/threonine protein kinase